MNCDALPLPTFAEPGIEESIAPEPVDALDPVPELAGAAGAGAGLAGEVGCPPRRSCAAVSLGWASPKPPVMGQNLSGTRLKIMKLQTYILRRVLEQQ